MIISFKSRALQRYWEKDDGRKLPAARLERIAMILDRLDAATAPRDLDLQGLKFHPLTGDQTGRYSVQVTANWRITFAFDGENAVSVDFEDYH
jgi:proteic killer suppression protein